MSLYCRQRFWVCIVDWDFEFIVDGDSEFADSVHAAADDGGWQGGGSPGSRRTQPRNLVWIYQRYRQIHSGRMKGSPAWFIHILLSVQDRNKISWICVPPFVSGELMLDTHTMIFSVDRLSWFKFSKDYFPLATNAGIPSLFNSLNWPVENIVWLVIFIFYSLLWLSAWYSCHTYLFFADKRWTCTRLASSLQYGGKGD